MSVGNALAYSDEEQRVQCGAGSIAGLHPYRLHVGGGLTALQAECTFPRGRCFVLSHARDLYV